MKPRFPDQRDEDATLLVQFPAATKRAHHIQAATAGKPVRLFVLKTLAAYGINVPDDALTDRRMV